MKTSAHPTLLTAVFCAFLINLVNLSSVEAQPHVDQVAGAELQFALCAEEPSQIASRLESRVGAQLRKSEIRQTYYLENAERGLEAKGVVIRYRETKKNFLKSAVKHSYPVLTGVPPEVFSRYGKGCEVDAYYGHAKIGCSVKDNPAALGELGIDQQDFLKLVMVYPHEWRKAQLIGPVKNEAKHFNINNADYTLEATELLDRTHLVELSTRVALKDAEKSQKAFYALAQRAGLTLCPDQTGVTKKILDQFLGPAHK